MSAETIVYEALRADVALTALVADRIFPDFAAQGSQLPLLIYERTGTEPVSTIHDGVPVASDVTISISAWTKTRAQAEAIADAVAIALRDPATPIGRFGHFDDVNSLRAEVTDFSVWEL